MKNVTTAICEFNEGFKKYYFLTTLKLKQGDKVVVDCSTGIQIGTVKEVHKDVHPQATAWVVQKVNFRTHNARLAKIQRINDIKGELLIRRAAIEERGIYERLSKSDSIVADLFKELKKLEG